MVMRAGRCVVSLVWSLLAIGAASFVPPLRAQFVYVVNQSGTVSAYSIGATGALTPIGGPVASGNSSAAVDPAGKFLYVANETGAITDGSVSAYSIGATGELTPIGGPVATGFLPSSVAVNPTGKFVYVTNGSSDT